MSEGAGDQRNCSQVEGRQDFSSSVVRRAERGWRFGSPRGVEGWGSYYITMVYSLRKTVLSDVGSQG